MGTKKKKEQLNKSNLWDFLINFTNHTFELVKSGHATGAILLISLICFTSMILKLSPENADKHLSNLFQFLGAEKFYFVPFLLLLIFIIYACITQRRVYKEEIKRLKDLRSLLMHGKENNELKELKKHNPSNFNFESEG